MPILAAALVWGLVQTTPDPVRQSEELIEKLRADSPEERLDASRKLKELGAPALAALERGTKDPDVEVASRCSQLIRSIRLRERLGRRLLQEYRGLEDRLVDARKETWTRETLKILDERWKSGELRGLRPWDLDPLIVTAIEGAGVSDQRRLIELSAKASIPGSFPALKKLAESADPDQDISVAAMRAMGEVDSAAAVPVLIGLLRSPGDTMRLYALQELRDRLGADIAGAVRPLLNDRDDFVQCEAATILGELGDPASVNVLESLMAAKSSGLRYQVATALGRIGVRSSAAVLRIALKDGESDVRGAAAEALGLMDDSASAPLIAGKLAGEREPSTVRKMALALARLNSRDSVPALIKASEVPETIARSAILRALWKLEARDAAVDLARKMLRSKDIGNVQAGAEFLRDGLVKEAIPALREASEAAPESARAEVLQALTILTRLQSGVKTGLVEPAKTLEELETLLASPNEAVRWSAAESLRVRGDPAVIALLKRTLTQGPSPARHLAAGLRVRLEGAAVLGELLADSRAEVREGALEGLRFGRLRGDPEVIQKFADDPVAAVRREALWCLTEGAHPVEAARLEKWMNDADPEIQEAAIGLAGRLGVTPLLPKIQLLLNDSSDSRAGEILEVLAWRGNEQVSQVLGIWVNRRASAAEKICRGLGRRQEGGFEEILQTILIHGDPGVRGDAARVLCRRGSFKGVPVVFEREWDFLELNALREPAVFRRLAQAPSLGAHPGSGKDLLERCGKSLGMAVEIPAPGPDVDPVVLLDPAGFDSLRIRDTLLDDVKVAARGNEVLLEKDRIRVISAADARAFWQQWWRSYRLKQ